MQESNIERGIIMKLLLHIDQTERWQAVSGNLKNMTVAKQTHPDLELEIVVTGDAIQNLVNQNRDEQLYQVLKQAVAAGFKIKGCHNSMNHYHLDENQLFDFVEVVPAGLLEIGEKEAQGWGYVKP